MDIEQIILVGIVSALSISGIVGTLVALTNDGLSRIPTLYR
ncbi:hypothetical protein BH09ACT10_BH09ACT10_13810 [soil metagenome]